MLHGWCIAGTAEVVVIARRSTGQQAFHCRIDIAASLLQGANVRFPVKESCICKHSYKYRDMC